MKSCIGFLAVAVGSLIIGLAGCSCDARFNAAIVGERIEISPEVLDRSVYFERQRVAVATGEYERAVTVSYSDYISESFRLPGDPGAAGELKVYMVRGAKGDRFLKLKDAFDEFWIDLESPKAWSVANADGIEFAQPYDGEFPEIVLFIDPQEYGRIETAEDVISLKSLAGNYIEEYLGTISGNSRHLKMSE